MKIYSLKVFEIKRETSDTLTILFKQPALKRIKYLAGQYLSLIFRINGRRYIRPYSFSSAPGVDDTLNITVKQVQGGVVSNHIIDMLKVGDIVEAMEPMGDFTLDQTLPAEAPNIFLWGAGSGVTPLISIAKYALHNKKANSITLAYGNRYFEEIIFSNDIKLLTQQFDGVFSAMHFITKPFVSTDSNIVQGRITLQDVAKIIKARPDFIANSVHYICGPAGLKDTVKMGLKTAGVDDGRVFTEDFEVVRNPKDFENIHTQNVLIKTGNSIKRVEVPAGKSILEAGLDAQIELAYSCQTGNCLVCKAKIIKGGVKMIGVKNQPAILTADEYLLCCSFPVTEDVEIIVE